MKFKYLGNDVLIEGITLIRGEECEILDEKLYERIKNTLGDKIEDIGNKKGKKKEVEENDR